MPLTSDDGIGAQLNELALQLFPQPFYVVLFRFVRVLESFCVCRGDVVEVGHMEDIGVRSTTSRMVCKGKGGQSISVERQLTADEVDPLSLLGIVEVLSGSLHHTFHRFRAYIHNIHPCCVQRQC